MAHSALFAPDVLHEIFLRLPQQDLLLLQRVCRMWRDIVSGSNALQAALFLQPDAERSTQRPTDSEVVLNPLPRSRFPSFFEPSSTAPPRLALVLGPWFDSHWAESLRSPPPSAEATSDSAAAPFAVRLSRNARYPELDQQRSAAYRRPSASWRRMISCRPAPRELQVIHSWRLAEPRSAAGDSTIWTVILSFSSKNAPLTWWWLRCILLAYIVDNLLPYLPALCIILDD